MVVMATPTDEIRIDLDALDAEAAKKPKKIDPKAAKDPEIEIVKTDPVDAPADRTVLKPEEGLEKLKKQLEDEKAARADAERRANEASQAEVAARTESHDNRLHLVTTAIENIKTSSKSLRGEYAAALAAQDYDKAAEIQESMSDNSAKLIQLESGKKALESAPKPTPRQSSDPVEQFTATLSPRSAAWVRAHPEYVRDTKLNRQMLRA